MPATGHRSGEAPAGLGLQSAEWQYILDVAEKSFRKSKKMEIFGREPIGADKKASTGGIKSTAARWHEATGQRREG